MSLTRALVTLKNLIQLTSLHSYLLNVYYTLQTQVSPITVRAGQPDIHKDTLRNGDSFYLFLRNFMLSGHLTDIVEYTNGNIARYADQVLSQTIRMKSGRKRVVNQMLLLTMGTDDGTRSMHIANRYENNVFETSHTYTHYYLQST